MKRRHRAPRGFTLMELMMAVVVVAILAAVAYPVYTEALRKGWRAEARTALMQEMQQQERFHTQRATYSATPFRSDSGLGSGGGKYTLAVGTCAGQADTRHCIRLTATLRRGFVDPAVQALWLDSRGEKGCTGTVSPAGCWP
ncbi:type IV pilin protein [Variovorax boronicumulans]|uniref:type IV pilin protein n=1 Tax=Variovorax boronicumulans TaxID=436515 RepID=UPI001C56BEA9